MKTTMILSTPQSTNITFHSHQHYHDTAHTPINKYHIPPSWKLPWYCPHPNQQTSHPTIMKTTMIPSTPQSTNITFHSHQHYHDSAHTPINKHHIPPSWKLPWYCPHPNQQTSHPTITNTTMIPSTPQSTNITSHRHQHYHDTLHTPINKHHIPPSPTQPRYRPHPNQQTSHSVNNTTLIPSTPQSTNITYHRHQHYHDTVHTPINKHHIQPSPTQPRYRPHPNQQSSHPIVTNTTMIPSTPKSTNITSHHHLHNHDTVHTPMNKHHIPSTTLHWYRPHPNQQTSHPTVTNTTMIPSTPQSTNITSHRHQHYHDTVHIPINKHHIPPSPTEPRYRSHPNQQTTHPSITNTTMISSTPQSTYITFHRHQHYHDTVHTPINKHLILPSPTLPWYRPHPNQQTSHPTITNTTTILSTPQSTNITSHHHQHYHDTVHTPINKHHIPPSPTLPWCRTHTNFSCVPLSNQHLFTVPLLSYTDTHSVSLLEMPSQEQKLTSLYPQ